MPIEEIPPAAAAPAAAPARAAPPAKPATRRATIARRILFFSVLAHVIFGAGAAVWIVQFNRDRAKTTFKSVAPGPSVSHRVLEHKVAMKRKAMSAPVSARRATTTGLSKVTLPPMPLTSTSMSSVSPSSMVSGMGGAGIGSSLGGGGGGMGMGKPGGTMFMASIGGLNVQARQLAVALDASGSVVQYQESMQSFVAKNFPKSEVSTFSFAGFTHYHGRLGSIGTTVLEFLQAEKPFDSIYIFSDFGDMKHKEHPEDALSEIQKLVREKKVRLYLHVLRQPGRETDIDPELQGVINFARSTGGNVKIGTMPRM